MPRTSESSKTFNQPAYGTIKSVIKRKLTIKKFEKRTQTVVV